MTDRERRTPEGFRRLIAFADAVVAIALTLLVLPLADITQDLKGDTSVGQVLGDSHEQVVNFLISFVVIWVLWRNHHRVIEHFRAYDPVLMKLHFVWLLTIVVLPFATALVDNKDIRYANLLYIGVLAVSILSILAMRLWARRHRDLLEDDDADVDEWVTGVGGYGTALLIVVAFVVALVFPATGNMPLFLLFFTGPLEKALDRWRKRNITG